MKTKKITFKKMQEIHPEFELKREGEHIDIRHKATRKKVVCIIGNKVSDCNDFLERIKESPESYLNNSSFFRHVDPTCPSPYKDGQQVEVVASKEDLESHFGTGQKFCSPGDTLTIDCSHWAEIDEEWIASFDNPNDFGGFWLQPEMIK
jgi:hypothetical protein